VIAQQKKGYKNTFKNYRPVLLLVVAGMILENVGALQICTFIS
jgi:hypothetical protein